LLLSTKNSPSANTKNNKVLCT